jgi:putative endonuclease
MSVKGGCLYMMSDRYRGGIYTGVTADVARRVWQHREGQGSRFVARYRFRRLVYIEWHDGIDDAMRARRRSKSGGAPGRSS